MASTADVRSAQQPPCGPGQPGPPGGQEQGAALGLVSATALVMGSIIGVGVFTMPAVLAGIVLYAFLNARRERLGQIPGPADNPPGDTASPAPADTRRERAAGKGEM